MKKGKKSIADKILAVLEKNGEQPLTVSEIAKKTRIEEHQTPFVAVKCLSLVERGLLKRRKIKGIWAYSLRKPRAA